MCKYKQQLTLFFKELRFLLFSLTGVVFILLFLIVSGCLLWIVPGIYNIPDNGYATFSSFFSLTPVLFLFLIPALAMRSLSEEKRMRTWLLLRSRPVTIDSIVTAKQLAILVVVLLTLLPSLISIFFIYYYGSPVGSLDVGVVVTSYLGLIFLIIAFINIAVFASSVTSNQVVALILGMLLCAFFYYGFDLLSLPEFGFLYHYKSIQRGVIVLSDLCYFLGISVFFSLLTFFFLRMNFRSGRIITYGLLLVLCVFQILTVEITHDVTKDKRYSVHRVSKDVLKELTHPVYVDIYLAGNLNPGFRKLQQSATSLLEDFDKVSLVGFSIVDPYKKGKEFIELLSASGIKGVAVNERLSNGRISQHILYPYAQISYKDKQIVVPLLVNQPGKSGEENLNLSIEMLEYQFIHAIELLSREEGKRVAFLEGHGELSEEAISEAVDLLSYEYEIDRGVLSGVPGELDNYDLVIIAGSRMPFSETDKFVLDQYLMQGGRLLWFINGVQLYSYQQLIENGETMSMVNDLNLNDLFFTYGLRINHVLLQDVHSLNIPVPVVNELGETEYVSHSWYYAPLLFPGNQSEITKGLSFVKTSFASTISLVGEDAENNKEVLLTSSTQAKTLAVPAIVSMEEVFRPSNIQYFRESNLPVAVLVNPPLKSAFKNRNSFFLQGNYPYRSETELGKMIVVASEDVITNPLGYDNYSRSQFANQEFLLNSVNYLTDSKGVSVLKNKSFQMQLLNKKKLQEDKRTVVFYNVIFPPLLLLIVFIFLFFYRKRKYERKVES